MLFIQLLLQGLQVGAIYALTAAGFALIFGATRIFHFAHGSSFALAGYVFIFAMQAGWPWWLGGLMIESNLVAGNQPILADRSQMTYGCSVTDGCVDWDTTEKMIRDAAARLRPVLAQRVG